MNLTERILELLKSNTLKAREVADILDENISSVSGTINRLVRKGLVVVVDNSRKGHWTYRAAKGAGIKPALSEQINELLKSQNLTAPEIKELLGTKVSTVASNLSARVRTGQVRVVGKELSKKTGGLINVYGLNPDYAKKGRSVKVARTSEAKELSKHFRLFRPTYGPVMGVWV